LSEKTTRAVEVLTGCDKALGGSFEDGEMEVELEEGGITEWPARWRGTVEAELGSPNGDGGAGKLRARVRKRERRRE
jgi:hypothetical protein